MSAKKNPAHVTAVAFDQISTLPNVRQALDHALNTHLSAIRANDVVARHYRESNTLAPLPDIQALAVALTSMVQAQQALILAIAAGFNR